jgi:hypothetical protein
MSFGLLNGKTPNYRDPITIEIKKISGDGNMKFFHDLAFYLGKGFPSLAANGRIYSEKPSNKVNPYLYIH